MRSYTRRWFLRSIPASLVATAGCAAPTRAPRRTATAGSDGGWPTFRGDRRNTGCCPATKDLLDDPSVAWSHETGGDIWGSPVVVDGVVYVGSHDTNLYALDAESGAVVWTFETGGLIEGSPALRDGTCYFGSIDTNVYAVDARTGEEQWRYRTGGLIRGSPAVDRETVYIGGNCRHLECEFYGDGETPTTPEGGAEGYVFALTRERGTLRWRFETGDGVVSTPAIGDGRIYVGSSDGNVYAIRREAGEEVWRYETGDWVFASPSLENGTVYVPSMDGIVHAIDAETGRARWTHETRARYISGSTAVCNDTVYVGVPAPPRPADFDDLAKVHALSASTGEPRWTFHADLLEIGSSPAVTGKALYIGSHNVLPEVATFPKLYSLDLDGQERWSHGVRGEGIGSSPALVGESLFFGGSNGTMYALE